MCGRGTAFSPGFRIISILNNTPCFVSRHVPFLFTPITFYTWSISAWISVSGNATVTLSKILYRILFWFFLIILLPYKLKIWYFRLRLSGFYSWRRAIICFRYLSRNSSICRPSLRTKSRIPYLLHFCSALVAPSKVCHTVSTSRYTPRVIWS